MEGGGVQSTVWKEALGQIRGNRTILRVLAPARVLEVAGWLDPAIEGRVIHRWDMEVRMVRAMNFVRVGVEKGGGGGGGGGGSECGGGGGGAWYGGGGRYVADGV